MIDALRQHLLNLLVRYGHRYPDEAACVDRFTELVRGDPHCFMRSRLAGHLTGSAWVVNHSGDAVLLTHHRKLNIWLQLGGHADGQTDILAAARREAREESGLSNLQVVIDQIFDLDVHPIPARKGEPAHLHYDIRFALRATSDQPFIVSDESHNLVWVPLDELERYTTEHTMLRMREKWWKQNAPGA